MKANMLAAGIGSRLGFSPTQHPAKVLLRYGGKSLLQLNTKIFSLLGIDVLVLGVGYHHQDTVREIAAIGAYNFVRTVFNKYYEKGNIVTLWKLRDALRCGERVLLMDADVLYDEELLTRLINSDHQNCLLLDHGFDPGDEPVKICVRDGEIIEFCKWLNAELDSCGDPVRFFKLSAEVAKRGHHSNRALFTPRPPTKALRVGYSQRSVDAAARHFRIREYHRHALGRDRSYRRHRTCKFGNLDANSERGR